MYLEIIDLHSANTDSEKIERLFIAWQETFEAEHKKLKMPFYPQRFWETRFKINILHDNEIIASLAIEPHNYNHRYSTKKMHYLEDNMLDNAIKMNLLYGCIFEQLFVAQPYRKWLNQKVVDTIIGCGYEFMKNNNYNSMTAIARADKKIDQIACKFGAEIAFPINLNNTPCSFIYTLKNCIKFHSDLIVQENIKLLWNTTL